MLLQCLRHISKRFSIHLQRFINIPRGIPGRDRVRNVMSSACYDRGTFLHTDMKDSMFLCQKSEKNNYCCLEVFNCCNSPLLDIRFPCSCLESHFPEKVTCTSSVLVSYKIPILVTWVRFPASADPSLMQLQCLRHISKRFSIHLQRFIHIPRGIPGRDRVRNVMSSACYDRGTFLPTVIK